MTPQEIETLREALRQAINMLKGIANGRQYTIVEYSNRIRTYEAALKETP